MLSNIFRDLHSALLSSYMDIEALHAWSGRFFNYDYQPAFWLIDLISCSEINNAVQIIEDAQWHYNIHANDSSEAYAGFSYLAYKENKLSVEQFLTNLINHLDGGEEIGIHIPHENQTEGSDYWIDLEKLGCLCKKNYQYLLLNDLYRYERDILFDDFKLIH